MGKPIPYGDDPPWPCPAVPLLRTGALGRSKPIILYGDDLPWLCFAEKVHNRY